MSDIHLDHISHSQLELYDKCPRAWMYRYIEGIRGPASAPLVLGDCYHQTIETNFKYKMSKGADIDIDFIPDVYKRHWNHILDTKEIIWGDDNPNTIRDIGIALSCRYVDTVAPKITPAKIELWLESEVADTKFVIRIDLIDHMGVVIDHKTSKKKYSQKDTDDDMQASACAFALGRSILFCNHVAVKTGKKDIQILKTYRTQDDIDWWYKKASETVYLMKSGHYPPRPQGWYCDPRYCDFYEGCKGHLTKVFIG